MIQCRLGWDIRPGVRDNNRMRQLQLFTSAELARMRDRTKARNYSPERDEFRRDHERRRAFGLARRHAERLRHAEAGPRPEWMVKALEECRRGRTPESSPPPPPSRSRERATHAAPNPRCRPKETDRRPPADRQESQPAIKNEAQPTAKSGTGSAVRDAPQSATENTSKPAAQPATWHTPQPATENTVRPAGRRERSPGAPGTGRNNRSAPAAAPEPISGTRRMRPRAKRNQFAIPHRFRRMTTCQRIRAPDRRVGRDNSATAAHASE